MEDIEPPEECPNILPPSTSNLDPQQSCAPPPEVRQPSSIDTGGDVVLASDDDPIIPFDPDNDIALHPGDDLSPEDVNAMSRIRPVRLISFVGPTQAGKTSLFASIYNRFLDGPFAQCKFGGTDSIVGFEQRVHDTRLASRRTVPYTPHTQLGQQLKFLHLFVRDQRSNGRRFDLLFADRSGEYFTKAIDNTSLMSEFTELDRAQHVVVLVDGEKLKNPEFRTTVCWQTKSILRALRDCGRLHLEQEVSIVLSKFDEIKTFPDRPTVEHVFNDLHAEIKSLLDKHVRSVMRFRIAACPKIAEAGLVEGYGVDKLMRGWLTSRRTAVKDPPPSKAILVLTEFDRFGLRYRANPRG